MSILPGALTAAPALTVRPPRIPATLLCGLAVLLSLTPSLLPRPAWAQGVLTGLLVAAAYGVVVLGARLRRTRSARAGERPRWLLVGLAAGVAGATTMLADASLNASRAGLGLPPPEASYWPTAAAVAVLTSVLLVRLALALGTAARRLRSPRVLGVTVTVVALLAAVGPGVADAGWRALAEHRDDPRVLAQRSPIPGSVRTYVTLDEAATADQRAALAVERLEAAGGLDRDAVMLAVPTGSGWVNPDAVVSFERDLAGGLATVAVQAGYGPSWVEMFFHREEQEAAARALYEALAARLATLPEAERPRLYVYGESLGALVGQSVLAAVEESAGTVEDGAAAAGRAWCGAVWAGVPGDARLGASGERVHRNPDDPVVQWQAATLVDRPDRWSAPVWLPGVSYLTTTLDLLGSLGTPPGHGHVYGPEQPWHLPAECGSTVTAQALGG